MTRAAAAKASAAADALLDWLRTQTRDATPEIPATAGSAASLADATGTGRTEIADAAPVDPVSAAPAPGTIASGARWAAAPGEDTFARGAPQHLPHTDWLHHRLTILGPVHDLAAFRAAAAGAGTIPWQFDLDRMEEDFFHLLVAPPPPQQRSLSLTGARIVAGQLRAAVSRRHALAVARVGSSRTGAVCRACPFDLRALVPVPDTVLRLGPDDPASLSWLWENWGTTQALRHVAAQAAATGTDDQDRLPPGEAAFRIKFWSADWTPWRALAQIATRWTTLRFEVRPSYDPP
ncbi:MAG: hypothetical protein M0Z28_28730 [Rhodospirillales bacterium]|nr:hypothetical protein [Rhodospirillales bacterium]